MHCTGLWRKLSEQDRQDLYYNGANNSAWRIDIKEIKCSEEICTSVQFSPSTCPTLCNPMDYSTPGFPVHHQILELSQTWSIESVMPSNHLILCRPLLLLPSIFSSIRVFSSESALQSDGQSIGISVSISPSSDYSELIYFRMDWLDLLAVQGTLKSLLQHHSSKAPILQCSAFFMVQLSHPYITTGKNIALTRWIFDGKVMSLLFNMLSRLIIFFFQGASVF